MIPGIVDLVPLYQGRRTRVFRARRAADATPVIVKTLAGDYPLPEQRARLRLEHAVITGFDDPGIVRALDLVEYGNNIALVLEDIGAAALSQSAAPEMPIGSFLNLAVELATLVGRIHRQGLIHKDINPANIILNPATGRVQIIDFDIATRLDSESVQAGSLQALEGTLPYIAPEQTGRMNRALDWRADFYSLGVTFYELLTGLPPFLAADPLDYIYQHLAAAPEPPATRRPEIPEPLSDIVLKLLAKSAEDRYQGAFGLVNDLECCRSAWRADGAIAPFPLAQRDTPDRFRLPQRLYGRDTEIASLLAAFDRAAGGRAELMLVRGAPGIGKTAVVNEVQPAMVARRGQVIVGKFDQLQRNEPYSALVRAFGELVQRLLGEPELVIAAWRERIGRALAPNAGVLVEVIPVLELLLGLQPEVPELRGRDARNRFNLVFRSFVEAVARPEHPVVLFVDDLQWADLGSLELLQYVLADHQLSHVFVIGAYRDTEVYSSHPLVETIATIRAGGAPVHEIALDNLDAASVGALVADAVRATPEGAADLAELAVAKTAGNPFFLRRFLRYLAEEGHLRFDEAQGGWQWDIAAIRELDISDNVLVLLMQQMLRLDAAAREAVTMGACLGGRFRLATLARVMGTTPAAEVRALEPALKLGLLHTGGSAWRRFLPAGAEAESLDAEAIDFRFAHDRMQQAAYSLLPESERPARHLAIGRALWPELADSPAEAQRIFDVANHLNLGRALIEDPAERVALAVLNRRAAALARSSAAYTTARTFLAAAIELLGADAWVADYDLALGLHQDAAEMAYASAELAEAYLRIDTVLAHAQSPLDAAPAHLVRLEAMLTEYRLAEVVQSGVAALATLGVHIPADPTDADVGAGLMATLARLDALGDEAIEALPEMTDPTANMAIRIASFLSAPMIYVNGRQFIMTVLEILRLTVEHGVSAGSAYGLTLFGTTLCGALRSYEAGFHYGQLGVGIAERLGAREVLPRVTVTYETSVRHWKDAQANSLAPLLRGQQVGLEVGDFEFAMLCGVNRCIQAMLSGQSLDQVSQATDGLEASMSRLMSHRLHEHNLSIQRQLVDNLTGHSAHRVRLVGGHFDEDKERPAFEAQVDTTHLAELDMCRTMLGVIFGEHEQALADARMALERLPNSGWFATMWRPVTWFHAALAILNAAAPGSADALLAECLDGLTGAAASAPMNYGHKLDLVHAEQARSAGDFEAALSLYDRAIDGARQQRFMHDEALAAELAGRACLAAGHARIADTYLRAARQGWLTWGATAKVLALDTEFPGAFAIEVGSDRVPTTTVGTTALTAASIDLRTVIRANQAISEEIELDRLLATLIQAAVENAGADSGVLVDMVADEPAAVVAWRHGEAPERMDALALDDCDRLSSRVVRSVLRTRQPLILADALHQGAFTDDPHLQRVGARAVLCLPVLRRGALAGALYLENTRASNAFTAQHAELLGMLCGQIAISLENARLYDRLAAVNRAYQRFVPEQFLALLDKGSVVDVSLGDQALRDMTVLFSDVRGFSRQAESLTPAATFELLNAYFGRMVPLIQRLGGVVDKYVGDLIMALFPEPGGADLALRAALAMLRERDALNHSLALDGRPPLALGIGLHTGPVMLGTVGTEVRMDGTVIGDTVNLASRIEGMTKQFGIALALSQATHDALEFPSNFLLRDIDRVQALGRNAPVTVYEVFEADPPDRAARKRESRAGLSAAIAHYRARDFDACESECRLLQLMDPDDAVVARYLARCIAIREHGLSTNEDMVEVLTSK
jgi:predicted ATPase/class 3 adenylate cyclase